MRNIITLHNIIPKMEIIYLITTSSVKLIGLVLLINWSGSPDGYSTEELAGGVLGSLRTARQGNRKYYCQATGITSRLMAQILNFLIWLLYIRASTVPLHPKYTSILPGTGGAPSPIGAPETVGWVTEDGFDIQPARGVAIAAGAGWNGWGHGPIVSKKTYQEAKKKKVITVNDIMYPMYA